MMFCAESGYVFDLEYGQSMSTETCLVMAVIDKLKQHKREKRKKDNGRKERIISIDLRCAQLIPRSFRLQNNHLNTFIFSYDGLACSLFLLSSIFIDRCQ